MRAEPATSSRGCGLTPSRAQPPRIFQEVTDEARSQEPPKYTDLMWKWVRGWCIQGPPVRDEQDRSTEPNASARPRCDPRAGHAMRRDFPPDPTAPPVPSRASPASSPHLVAVRPHRVEHQHHVVAHGLAHRPADLDVVPGHAVRVDLVGRPADGPEMPGLLPVGFRTGEPAGAGVGGHAVESREGRGFVLGVAVNRLAPRGAGLGPPVSRVKWSVAHALR